MSMKRFPKLRPCLWDAVAALAVVVLAVICAVTIWGGQDRAGQPSVVISVDGREVERCLLTEFPDAEQYYTNNGYTLCVTLVEDGDFGITVKSSDCPTQDCVHTGTITRSGQSIVCLPARVIIQLEGGSGGNDVDMVVG